MVMDQYNDVYLLEGNYGVGKTTYAVSLMMHYLVTNPNSYIFTDIKILATPVGCEDRLFHYIPTRVETIEIQHYSQTKKVKKVFFSIMDMLEICRLVKEEFDLSGRPRSQRLRFYFFLDETGDVFNKYLDSDDGLQTLYGYIVQMRKFNIRIYLISQEYIYLTLRLRLLVRKIYRLERIPLLRFPPFSRFSLIYRSKKDPDTGHVMLEKKAKRNKEGDWYDVDVPVGGFHGILYKRKWWRYYDDLYVTMRETYQYALSATSQLNLQKILSHFKKGYSKLSWKHYMASIVSREMFFLLFALLYCGWWFFMR